MTKVKNITDGPKIINGEPNVVLQAGEERDDLVISDAELASARGTGWFEIDGSIDPLDHDGDGKKGGARQPVGDTATVDEIKSALDLLDKDNAEHWTAAGLPSVEAVATLTGKIVTRKAIEEAAPDAKRPTE